MEIRKNILVVATQPQRFLEQISFANSVYYIKENINIYFFISEEIYNYYSEIVDNLKFKIINKPFNSYKKFNKQNYLKNFIKKNLTLNQKKQISKYIYTLENTFIFTNRLKKQEKIFLANLEKNYDKIFKLVQEYKIDVLLINGDRHLGLEPLFLKVAKDLKIPTIIPYMVYFAEQEDLVKTSTIIESKTLLTSKYIKDSEKKFIHHKRENKYYYPHTIANALDELGVLTKNPWFMGGGSSGILCLPNYRMNEHYINNGVDSNKIKVLGDTSYDQLYLNYKNRVNIKQILLEKYSFINKKIIIVALPQLGEHNILPWDKHWEEINYLMKSLNELNENILISLHPKMDRKKYEFLEDKYNCTILDERLADVLPIADMFVATFSSTVLWSILCGIKTVVVDFYGLNYTMYDFLTSIKKVDKKENLETVLKTTLIEEIDFSKDWKSLSRDEVFDGKTIQRYINLINEVSKQ